jgi:hypothetical protein
VTRAARHPIVALVATEVVDFSDERRKLDPVNT